MYLEDDLLPISGLQHLVFCERQWALIHLEQVWEENRLTVEGKQLHERADEGQGESRGDLRIARALPLRSLRLGLSGRADVVEFHRVAQAATPPDAHSTSQAAPEPRPPAIDASRAIVSDLQRTLDLQPILRKAISLPGASGEWIPFPVEYKRGKPKPDRCDEAQLCAQAICLEEMLGVAVPGGALFYGKPRRRTSVMFDDALRLYTLGLAARLHQLTRLGVTPPAVYEKKCENCSLIERCMPKLVARQSPGRSARAYLSRALATVEREDV